MTTCEVSFFRRVTGVGTRGKTDSSGTIGKVSQGGRVMRKSWFANWRTSERRSQRRSAPLATNVELMEVRQLLAASALFIPASGELNVQLGSQENVRISAPQGAVLIEISTGSGPYAPLSSTGTILAANVRSLVILGGDEANTIDLNGVTASAFSSLTSIQVDGANGHDTIIGSPDFADSLTGGHGHDTILGQGGNDTIVGGDGNDSIDGGSGEDSLRGGDGHDLIQGGLGNDRVESGDGNDTVAGGDGDDFVFAGNGQDSLNGNLGNDTLNGDGGVDTVSGDDGDDSILGGEFDDSLLGGFGNDTINGQGGHDNIDGGDGDDSLLGSAGADRISGGLGNDIVNGGAGHDQLLGDDGNDLIVGGAGDDTLSGDLGNDTLIGNAGNDSLVGGGGTDSLNGGDGNDFLASTVQSITIVSAAIVSPEGDAVNTAVNLTVSLSFQPQQTITVDFRTVDLTATAGSDYLATSGTLVFAPGVTTQTITVTVLGDTLVEGNESFAVELSNPVGAPISQGTSIVTIVDDDVFVSQFDIQINFLGGLTPTQQALFTLAEQRWESIIVGDVLDVFVPGLGIVDDIVIDASGVAIDGPGGILGQAGPNFMRPISFLPASGSMQFDIADLAQQEASGELFDTILHEMAHVLGFGTIWTDLNLLVNPAASGGTDPRFIGPMATAEYNARFGTNDTGVPVEATGGPGTEDAHWRQSIFINELMVGTDTPGANPLSRITIAQFADLGYQVDFTPANPFRRAAVGVPTAVSPLVNQVDLDGDTLVGGGGDDTIQGADGNDFISGQGGNDSLLGGAGNDSLLGGAGQDTLDGQAGDDTLDGQGGSDTVFGGDGNDTFLFVPDKSGVETVFGGEGFNSAQINGTGNADTINVGVIAGAATVTAGSSTLVIDSVLGNIQGVIVDGRGGDDVITIGDLVGGGFFKLDVRGGDGNDTLTAQGTNSGQVRLSLSGDNGNDTLIGSASNDTLDGGAGDDGIHGGAGNDLINGGAGNDSIGGGLGNDTIIGGDGNDFANGDAGDDSVIGSVGNDTLRGGDGNDTLLGVAGDDNLNGMAGDDSILGGVGQDAISGGAGNDTLDGGRNDDTINGNSGNDKIRGDHGNDYINTGIGSNTVNGGDGNDTIIAADGHDLLNGGDGNDSINAGGGNDILTGGDGNDTLLGGAGNDILLGGDGDDVINGQGATDTVAGNQGIDVIADPASEIDENFVLADALLTELEAAG
jgi:Ca2+-binding RTX toxin-like protein